MMLENKVALVTGCSRGIGRAIAEEYVKEGAIVYANVRKEDSLDKLKEQLKDEKGQLIPLCFDVCDRPAVKKAFVQIMKEQGRVDILVNNAGVLVDTLITMLNRATLREIYETNVFAVFECMSYASRIMQKQKCGAIINVASICGVEGGMRGQTAYSSSKGAVIALTLTAAKELGEFNVRVNAIAPGFIDTDMFRSGPQDIQERLVNGVYLSNRVGTPKECADACVFLASDKASYINGQVLNIDGFSHI